MLTAMLKCPFLLLQFEKSILTPNREKSDTLLLSEEKKGFLFFHTFHTEKKSLLKRNRDCAHYSLNKLTFKFGC
jgi:hypothetical protein